MTWVPIGAWIAAVVIAVVVLGFCAYEIVWKARRLARDVARLESTRGEVDALRAGLEITQQRIASVRID